MLLLSRFTHPILGLSPPFPTRLLTTKRAFKMKLRFSTWLLLTMTAVFAFMAAQTRDITMVLGTLFWGVLFVLALPLRRKVERDEKERELRCQKTKQLELEDFSTQRPRLQKLLEDGQLSCLEEWWEDDELWIDENAHLHFTFINGEEMDFILHDSTATELSTLLQTLGINWQASYRATHSSRIIWQHRNCDMHD